MSEYTNDDFWLRLADKLISYGTGRYNIKRIKRLSTRAIKASFYALDSSLRRILIQRYHEKKTLAAIGSELNMTPQGVRAYEQKAYDVILKFALHTRRGGFRNNKTCTKAMPLISKPCCDRRLVKNVLTELSPRIIRRLEIGGYRKMKQLCCAEPSDLKKIYGIGDVTLRKIQQAVESYHAQNPHFFIKKETVYSSLPIKSIRFPKSVQRKWNQQTGK